MIHKFFPDEPEDKFLTVRPLLPGVGAEPVEEIDGFFNVPEVEEESGDERAAFEQVREGEARRFAVQPRSPRDGFF